MSTYLELKQQAEQLMRQAEQMRQKETQDVIAEIRQKMQAYGLSGQDLGLSGSGAPRKRANKAVGKIVKFRGPNGETWGGGRGRKPQWVVDALAKGKSLDDFRVA